MEDNGSSKKSLRIIWKLLKPEREEEREADLFQTANGFHPVAVSLR
jgi:hypothetical protein